MQNYTLEMAIEDLKWLNTHRVGDHFDWPRLESFTAFGAPLILARLYQYNSILEGEIKRLQAIDDFESGCG